MVFVGKVCKRIVGIQKGTNYFPLLTDLNFCTGTKRNSFVSSFKGVGEGGAGGGGARAPSPHFQKWGGGKSGFVPPTFGQSKCSNFTIFSYFVVKNTFFFKIFLARFAHQL